MRAGAVVAALALLGACRGRAPEPPAGLLLVTIDTLRADRVGAYGSGAGATPNLDALAARGVVFEEALAAVPLTLPSHATILSGLEPVHHGVRDNGLYVFPESQATLATRLKEAGYATAAFVGAFVLDRRFGLARGFDRYDDRIARRRSGGSVLESERSCAEVVGAAEAWLAARPPGRFFLWAHFYDPHAPYDPPEPQRARFPGLPYEGDVALADACLGRLVASAESRAGGRLLVAAVADHGEGLGDHGEPTHGFFVYDSTLRVPMVLAGPGVPQGERRAGLARTSDLVPTLLARLGLPAPAGLDGQDLLSDPAPREAYAESLYPQAFGWAPLRALRLGSLKLVDAPRPELYDVAADPGEKRDLAASRPADVERLRAALSARRARERSAAPAAVDPASAERLRALGYVTGSSRPADGGGLDPKDALPLWRAFEEATWAEARGEREAAIEGLRALLRRAPANAMFRRSLSSLLRRAGRPAEALQALGDLERSAPDDAVAWLDYALALAEAGRNEEALRAARRSSALNPALAEPHHLAGRVLAALGRPAEALPALDEATRLDPNDAKAWNSRANALRALGRRGDAAADYARAGALDPLDPDPRNGLGVLAVEEGRLAEAAAAFERALASDPAHQEARLNLAVVAVQRGRLDEARALAERVVREGAASAAARRARALLADLRTIERSNR